MNNGWHCFIKGEFIITDWHILLKGIMLFELCKWGLYNNSSITRKPHKINSPAYYTFSESNSVSQYKKIQELCARKFYVTSLVTWQDCKRYSTVEMIAPWTSLIRTSKSLCKWEEYSEYFYPVKTWLMSWDLQTIWSKGPEPTIFDNQSSQCVRDQFFNELKAGLNLVFPFSMTNEPSLMHYLLFIVGGRTHRSSF